MWLHSMFDLSLSSLFFIYSLFRYHPCHWLWFIPFAPSLCSFLTLIYSRFDIYLHHSCVSHYQFDLISHLIIDIILTLDTLRSMTHELFYTCCILYMRAWVFNHWVFEPSFLSFLLPYHPSLHYVLCLKTILRLWDQMSSSTASTLTGIWDLVDIWISSYFFF